jgi:hypothetical protein
MTQTSYSLQYSIHGREGVVQFPPGLLNSTRFYTLVNMVYYLTHNPLSLSNSYLILRDSIVHAKLITQSCFPLLPVSTLWKFSDAAVVVLFWRWSVSNAKIMVIPHTAYRVPHTAYRVPRTAYRIPHTAYRLPLTAYRFTDSPMRRSSTFGGSGRNTAVLLEPAC